MDVAFIISLLRITPANHLYCAVDVVEELLAGKQAKDISKDIKKGIYGANAAEDATWTVTIVNSNA